MRMNYSHGYHRVGCSIESRNIVDAVKWSKTKGSQCKGILSYNRSLIVYKRSHLLLVTYRMLGCARWQVVGISITGFDIGMVVRNCLVLI